MSNDNKHSRSNKFEKRRKNTKKISILMVVASILIVILLIIWFFGGKDKDTSSPDNNALENENIEKEENNHPEMNEESQDQTHDNAGNNANNEELEINESENTEEEEDSEVDIEQVEPSDDNVIEAYTGNWQPVGTVQEGPHTTNYDGGSQDRIEIKQAVMSATGLGEDMTEHWVGNGGDQKVIATVANQGNTEIYRVYLSWIDHEGWQVTKVERLKEV